jgi:hypothetical protein
MDTKIPGNFLMKLFHARTNAHVAHLSTRRYAAHMALGDFYETIIDHADSYAESFQGKYGLIPIEGKFVQTDKMIEMLEELSTWVVENRPMLYAKTDTELANVVDEVAGCINSTLYKLRFLG